MRVLISLCGLVVYGACLCGVAQTVQAAGYLLQPSLDTRITSTVTAQLEVGGNLLAEGENELESLPMSVVSKQVYRERLVKWSPDAKEVARSVRRYDEASATIKIGESVLERTLDSHHRELAAEIRAGYVTIDSLSGILSRQQQDLLNVPADTLAIDRLLPGREVAEGEGWDHELAAIAPLLGMDHVAVCEVRSVVTGESHDQAQIRMAGTVHGTIDGAPTEIDLRGAYLYHLKWKRITKFNLAIKEKRTANEVVPGLDTVAQVKLTIVPTAKEKQIPDDLAAMAGDVSRPLPRQLLYEAPQLGFRFRHDSAWYTTGEQSDVLSFRYLQEGSLTAHCNISTLPPRSAGRETTLEQFERDVRTAVGANLESVTKSSQWTTSQGNTCLGVFAEGQVEDVPVQWRYYLVAAPDLPRVTFSLTVEQSLIKEFADADRQLIDSVKLLPREPSASTASHNDNQSR